MKKFFTLIALAAMAFAAQANDLTVYDGTDQFDCIPINAAFMDWAPYTVQMIYPAAQIEAMKGSAISSLKFYVANENGSGMTGGKMYIYIGTTQENAFPTYSPSFIPVDGLTKVAEITMTTGEQEVVVNFDTPWTYEGDNLLVMTYLEEEGDYSGYTYFYGLNTTEYCSAYGRTYATAKNFGPKTTFTYEGGSEEPGIATLAEANALEDDTEFTFGGDAVVTLFQNGYLFLRDESGYAQIKGVTGEFANGQVLSEGWSATKTTITDPWVRYIDAAGLSASGETNAELAAAQKLTGAVDESMLNAYVYVENVTISTGPLGLPMRALPLPDGTSIGITSTLWGTNWPASGSKNVYGVICKDGNALKINIADFENYEEPQHGYEVGDVNHDGSLTIADVTMLISFVLKNGVGNACPICADVNGDESFTIADVTALISRVLKQN